MLLKLSDHACPRTCASLEQARLLVHFAANGQSTEATFSVQVLDCMGLMLSWWLEGFRLPVSYLDMDTRFWPISHSAFDVVDGVDGTIIAKPVYVEIPRAPQSLCNTLIQAVLLESLYCKLGREED